MVMDRRTDLSPASREEEIVYGACRPGYYSMSDSGDVVADWIDQMQEADIGRICCLLESAELEHYANLLERYELAFGHEAVRHVPIADYSAVEPGPFRTEILPFLKMAETNSEPVVVHCSAGMGRTGQVLALWLALERGYELSEAIREVEIMGRRPLEATTLEQLRMVLTG